MTLHFYYWIYFSKGWWTLPRISQLRDLKLPLCPCLINASFLSVLFLHSLKINLLNIYNVSRNLEMSQRGKKKAYPQHDNNSLEGLKDQHKYPTQNRQSSPIRSEIPLLTVESPFNPLFLLPEDSIHPVAGFFYIGQLWLLGSSLY